MLNEAPSFLQTMSPANDRDSDERYWGVATRLATHEAMCEERSKHIDARLAKIEKGIENINYWGIFIGFTLICGVLGLLSAILLK